VPVLARCHFFDVPLRSTLRVVVITPSPLKIRE
jgi:hypothetical protein